MNSIYVRLGLSLTVFYVLYKFLSFSLFYHLISFAGFLLILSVLAWELQKFIYLSVEKKFRVKPDRKSVLITGCDTGFGNLLARNLDKQGFSVYAGCLNVESDECKKLADETSDKLKLIQLNVSDENEINQAYETIKSDIEEKSLRFYGLVNNAGIAYPHGVIWGNKIYKDTLSVNFFGSVFVTQKFLPLLVKKEDSRIVFVSSLLGQVAFPWTTSYVSSKFALRAYATSLRRETKKFNLKVSIIEPVVFRTNITNAQRLTSLLHKLWGVVPPEVSENPIFSNQMEQLVKINESFSKLGHNPQIVVNSILTALNTSLEPDYYFKCGLIFEVYAIKALLLLPEEIQDFILDGSSSKQMKYVLKINDYFKEKFFANFIPKKSDVNNNLKIK